MHHECKFLPINFGNLLHFKNNYVYECDGSRRPITNEEQRALDQYGYDVKEYFRKLYPPGFPFVKGEKGVYPTLPNLCKTC